ncbi:MAG: hypothetical protein JW740_01200 [Candidatus Zambryskibacteria bacterium]|nr:hypothetical protein [Candidatus Zambryskibacteria bacterium]
MKQSNLFKEYKEVFEKEPEELKTKKEKIFSYYPFALQDALGERNVKKVWIEYEKLRFNGAEAEELVYKIISKLKNMLAIKLGASKTDLELKDYSYNKSKSHAKNWEAEKLEHFFTQTVYAYHASRMDTKTPFIRNDLKGELDLVLEKIILSI